MKGECTYARTKVSQRLILAQNEEVEAIHFPGSSILSLKFFLYSLWLAIAM